MSKIWIWFCKLTAWLWNFLNKPLIVVFLTFIFLFLVGVKFGLKEKIKCDYMVNPDVDYLKNQMNQTDTMVELFLKLYSEPFRANWTFDSYQEALAFMELTNDAIGAKTHQPKWYKVSLVCDEAKISLPKSARDILNQVVPT